MVQQKVNEGGTNAQQIKNRMETFLEVLELNREVGYEQARQCQESDKTLSDLRPIESTGEVKACRDQSTVKYFMRQSLYNTAKVYNVRLMEYTLALQQFKMKLEVPRAVTNLLLTFEQKVEGIVATVDEKIHTEREKNDYNHFFLLKDGDVSGIEALRLLMLVFMKRIACFLLWMNCFYSYLFFTIHYIEANLQ